MPANGPRVLHVQHPSDPIVRWSPRLILHRPDWLAERPGGDVTGIAEGRPASSAAQSLTASAPFTQAM